MRQTTLMILLAAGAAVSSVPAIAQGPGIEFLNSGRVLPKTLPFSEAVRVGDTLYLSGQIGIVPGGMKLVPGGIKAETQQTMDNIRTSLEAHGYGLADLVKCTVMLADMSEWGAFNEVYRSYFTGQFPARSALGVNGLALGARVEVECIAARVPRANKQDEPGRGRQ